MDFVFKLGIELASFPVVSSLSPGGEKQHRVRVRQTESTLACFMSGLGQDSSILWDSVLLSVKWG